jgi:hypothetical protein
MNRDEIFAALGLEDVNPGAYAGGWLDPSGPVDEVENPATGAPFGSVKTASEDDYERIVASAQETFLDLWARWIEWFDRYVKGPPDQAPGPPGKMEEPISASAPR